MVQTRDLSYFSCLADAETFVRQARAELHRRGAHRAGTVALVADGSLWIQERADRYRPHRVRYWMTPLADPRFGAQVDDVNAIYRGVPVLAERTVRIGATDGLTSVQAVERSYHDLSVAPPACHATGSLSMFAMARARSCSIEMWSAARSSFHPVTQSHRGGLCLPHRPDCG